MDYGNSIGRQCTPPVSVLKRNQALAAQADLKLLLYTKY